MRRLMPLLFISCLFLWLYPATALAADYGSEPASNVTITIVMPDTPATSEPAQNPPQQAAPETPAPQVPAAPVAPVISPLYPVSVDEIRESGGRRIIKVYELSAGENPKDIARDSFDRDRWHYELADITKSETATADAREHVETVEVNTGTNDTDTILRQLAPTLEYESEDGYKGVLTLNIASIKVEQAGTKTSSFTVTATREYPHLSTNDSSLVPKSITDGGKTYTLASVDWRAGNTETVDYERLPEYYTAYATYTATGSKTVVTGYITTAEYVGTVSKINQGKTVYTAFFLGTEIVPERVPLEIIETTPASTETPDESVTTESEAEISVDPTATPDLTPAPDPTSTPEDDAMPAPSAGPETTVLPPSQSPWPIVIPVALLTLLIGGGAGYFITQKTKPKKREDDETE